MSDEIIINLLSKRLEDGGNKGESGFILDGFPRTTRQAVSLTLQTQELNFYYKWTFYSLSMVPV